MFVVDEPYIAFDILDLLNTRIFLIPFYEGVIIHIDQGHDMDSDERIIPLIYLLKL